ncbi:MAG TPA: sulfatase-like hydrolase/transferase [Candidatus Paceibacterota bacterium]|nr:sulfatase-like hydrolase/transferase [Candidatus Paceibacterota bacterium]
MNQISHPEPLPRRARFFPLQALLSLLGLLSAQAASPTPSLDRPNILWITSEDTGPQIGAYGDSYAVTPHIDRLAGRGMIYLNAWANAPVCAPARTTIISGLYPPSTGSEHMRSLTRLPAPMKMFPALLRDAGYYCSNNNKEDYNLEKTGRVWDDSSTNAHWKNRRPGQPFFAVFNHTITHESQIRKRPHSLSHDPAKVRVPAYHPDTPEVRRDWAQYYDMIELMDAQVGQNLADLEQAGLAGDTVVFFFGDHGSGMPRSKRWPYNSGLHVPLVVYVPEKYRRLAPKEYAPGAQSSRLVSFVDLAPTMLSLASLKPPHYLQGRAFLGPYEASPSRYLHGFRGRMDERYDLVRSTRNARYIYIRNYMPNKIYGQHIGYMFQTPTTQIWKKLYDNRQLAPPQTFFWEPKPIEELYDLQNDPDEVFNLAGSWRHQRVLNQLRRAQHRWLKRIHDVGFLPEGEIHERSQNRAPYEMGHDRRQYPMEKILRTAELASDLFFPAEPELVRALHDKDSAVRYWAAQGLLIRGPGAVGFGHTRLSQALDDPSPYVRVVAAEALAKFGKPTDLDAALKVLGLLADPQKNGVFVSLPALIAIDQLGSRAAPLWPGIRTLPRQDPSAPNRVNEYPGRLIDTLMTRTKPASSR